MKELLVLCLFPAQLLLGQPVTPASSSVQPESRTVDGQPPMTADLLKTYIDMLQKENEAHRVFLKDYYIIVFAGFSGFAVLLGGVLAWMTWDTLKKVSSRVDERFEKEVKERVQGRVASIEKELRAAEGVSTKMLAQLDQFESKLQSSIEGFKEMEKLSRERFEKMDVIHSNLIEGRARYAAKLYKEAEPFFERVLEKDSRHVLAMICYGVCLSRSVPPKYGEALTFLNRAIEIDPRAWLAYYNRACVRFLKNNASLAGEDEATKILDDLRRTFAADPGYRDWARLKDADWEPAKSDERFAKLVNGT